ncbi:MAG: hypothetical protein ACRBG0_27390 [Lewinella sp.]|uniref:hypothetical protein n=1 Tax=Lewinella sp. TaxID=2004506 RepID=UPI003D6A5097
MNLYKSWGFQDNPFATVALEANEEGEKLLIGRDIEMSKIHRRIFLRPKCVTIEGYNGVGKTSLVNVAIYKLYKEFVDKNINQLFIPNPTVFQLSQDLPTNDFIDKVYYSIAQLILKEYTLIKRLGVLFENISVVENFLNTYQLHSLQGGIASVSFGESIELNGSHAFNLSGFRKIVDAWLDVLYKKKSGIVCIIDNVELVQTSKNAKHQLEYLRDELLTKKGLRWVLCGASGIILGCTSSPRLTGILHNPIEVKGFRNDEISREIFRSRINYYKIEKQGPLDVSRQTYLPINQHGFVILLSILSGNIRHALYYAGEFSLWCADNEYRPETNIEKRKLLGDWLRMYSEELGKAFDVSVSPKGKRFFLSACKLERSFSYSEHKALGFNSTQDMRNYVSELENLELLQSIRTEEDKRRRLIQLTPKGMILYVIGLNEE